MDTNSQTRTKMCNEAKAAGVPSLAAHDGKPFLLLTVEGDAPMLISGGDPYAASVSEALHAAGFVFNCDEEVWEKKPITVDEAIVLAKQLDLGIFCGYGSPGETDASPFDKMLVHK